MFPLYACAIALAKNKEKIGGAKEKKTAKPYGRGKGTETLFV